MLMDDDENQLIFVAFDDKKILMKRGYTTKLLRKALEQTEGRHSLRDISAVLRDEISAREAAQEAMHTFLLCHRRSRKHPQIKFDPTLPLPNELAQEIAKRILY